MDCIKGKHMNNENIESLLNTGFVELNRIATYPTKTIVTLGAPRGGTSMIAGALYHLGVFMGAELNQTTYEDGRLMEAVAKKDFDFIERAIRERNEQHDIWGWKQAIGFMNFEEIVDKLRNPHFIVIFRDIFAVANRNRISVSLDVVQNMLDTLELYKKITVFLKQTKYPCLLVSYEKALNNKKGFVEHLSNFIGIVDEHKINTAIKFIQPSPKKYLLATRTQGKGSLDIVTSKSIAGWARKINDTTPVKVRLLINNAREFYVTADKFRSDLLKNNVHPTGECAFRIELPSDLILQKGDIVSARIVGDVSDLMNSPRKPNF
jgi:hypothetical protein